MKGATLKDAKGAAEIARIFNTVFMQQESQTINENTIRDTCVHEV